MSFSSCNLIILNSESIGHPPPKNIMCRTLRNTDGIIFTLLKKLASEKMGSYLAADKMRLAFGFLNLELWALTHVIQLP